MAFMATAIRWVGPAIRNWLPIVGSLATCACDADQVYVLGRLPGSGGAAPEEAGGGASGDASCAAPAPHRDYVFFGSGTEVVDRQGGPPGEIRGGAVLDGSGELTLDGEDDYVDLPNAILAGLNEVTVVAWIRYFGGPAYTRIFDFGVGRDGEDPIGGLGTVGVTYLCATPFTGFVPSRLAALIASGGPATEIAAVSDLQLDDALQMVAVAASATRLELFDDGILIARVPNSVPLSTIDDVNNWLGRSQYDQDPQLRASYAGLQIFDGALSECAIRALHAAGPSAR
jgi:hypothetical protein